MPVLLTCKPNQGKNGELMLPPDQINLVPRCAMHPAHALKLCRGFSHWFSLVAQFDCVPRKVSYRSQFYQLHLSRCVATL